MDMRRTAKAALAVVSSWARGVARTPACCALVVAACPLWGQASPVAPSGPLNERAATVADQGAARKAATLLPDLGSPDFATRETARNELISLGAGVLPALREAYQRADDFEVRAQISSIAHVVFMDDRFFGNWGFLGISQDPFGGPTHEEDARIPKGHVGLKVGSVIDDTAAQTAGMANGDIIVALNDEYLKGHPIEAFQFFAQTIRESGAGAIIKLKVLRGPQALELFARLGRVPRQYIAHDRVPGILAAYRQAQSDFDRWWKGGTDTFATRNVSKKHEE